jgi:hypothetical protein
MAPRVGRRYIVGPADRPYVEGDPAFNVHTVVDDSTVEGCVTVENAAGHKFPVPATLVDDICEPAKSAEPRP